ncbi:MAG: tyrosine--tRNA ligase [Patescibacteria group bacterium]
MLSEFFKRGIVEIIEENSFSNRLKTGKPMRIKMGFDPTRPDLHLGHAVGLWKLRDLQDAGNTIIFLIGDYTTKIGDPSGRNTTRPILTDQEIKANAKTYFEQVSKILDIKKAEIRYNSEWFAKMNFADLLQLAGKFTVAQIIERNDFEKRIKEHCDIGIHELLYPLMQAYDSVVLEASVEMGGTDQKFNLMAGRDLQRKLGQEPQDIITVELLIGTDGKEKMSKSLDNYIGLTEDAKSMFGKVMSIPDTLIDSYFQLATRLSDSEIKKVRTQIQAGANPRDAKMRLAYEIVKLYHLEKEAKEVQEEFINVFSKKELPADIPEVKIPRGNYELPLLLQNIGAAESASEAKRLAEQGAVRIDEAKISDWKAPIAINDGMLVQVGKRKIYRIKIK